MAQVNFPRNLEFPNIIKRGSLLGAATESLTDMSAANEELHMIGQVILEDPNGGAKTLSSAGGKIHFRTGVAHVFANAGTGITAGLQDVSTASAPGRGDGVFDTSGTLTGGTGPTAASTFYSVAMTSGSKSIAHGQPVSVAMKMGTRAGVDVFVLATAVSDNVAAGRSGNTFIINRSSGGVWSFVTFCVPICGLEFDDGTVGWLVDSETASSQTAVSINLDSATADEYGNFIQFPAPVTVSGITALIMASGAAADYEMILYSDPLGTPTVMAKAAIDATQIGATGGGTTHRAIGIFNTPQVLMANTPYAITIRPTTTTAMTVYYIDAIPDTRFNRLMGLPQNGCYAIRRIDNAGAFSDYNGGVAKTRFMSVAALVSGFANDNGVGVGGTGGGFSYIVS